MVYRNSNKVILDSCEVVWCIGAFGVIVTNGLGRMLGCDSVAVQGMWRPALSHMHHAFLQRNYEKHLETMGLPGYDAEQVWPVVKERVLLLFQTLYICGSE